MLDTHRYKSAHNKIPSPLLPVPCEKNMTVLKIKGTEAWNVDICAYSVQSSRSSERKFREGKEIRATDVAYTRKVFTSDSEDENVEKKRGSRKRKPNKSLLEPM